MSIWAVLHYEIDPNNDMEVRDKNLRHLTEVKFYDVESLKGQYSSD